MNRNDADATAARPFVLDSIGAKSLHFAERDLQSRMSVADPQALLLDYTKTMMGFLLFVPRPRRIALIGLGGGSLAKFCHRELPETQIDVVEIDAQVVALREQFHVPPDDDRFRVHVEDGARFIAGTRERYDAILLDGYTADGIPPALASHAFYRQCRRALHEGGVLVSNLLGRDVHGHLARLRRAFRDQTVCFDEISCTNKTLVAFRCRGVAPPRPERIDAALLASPPLRALLPSLLSRCEALVWPTRTVPQRL